MTSYAAQLPAPLNYRPSGATSGSSISEIPIKGNGPRSAQLPGARPKSALNSVGV